MLIIANTFAFNGGTTFLTRFTKEYLKQTDSKVNILLLTNNIVKELEETISLYANIYYIKDFIVDQFKWMGKTQLSIYAPYKAAFYNFIKQHKNHIHVMGVFGLLLIHRLNKNNDIKYTIGAYHQNEYMYICNNAKYFQQILRTTFKNISANNLIFLNETRMLNYSIFFDSHINNGNIVPVGITKKESLVNLSNFDTKRIVSIGNLTKFKTYNKHIIELIPSLKEEYPNIIYDIYGDGDERINLENLVKQLNIESYVNFYGRIKYEDMENILKDTCLFVGNGTSIVEASSYSIPSIIGIESIEIPKTYGFLSDIQGLSYNEFDSTKELFDIGFLVKKLFNDKEYYYRKSNECYLKSNEYTINTTVSKFINIEKNIKLCKIKYSNVLSLFNFLYIGLLDKFNFDKCFKNRKIQSTKPIDILINKKGKQINETTTTRP